MVNPTAAELLELQEALYASKNPTRKWLHTSRRDWIEQAIRSCGCESERALEVGPGSGVYLSTLADVASEVVASDIEEAYLEQARLLAGETHDVSVVRDDITDSNLRPGSFQLILCTEVLEHIVDSRAALAGLANLLSSDGVLILTTPQRFSPLEVCAKVAFLPGIIQLVRWIYREPIIPTGHINLLTEGELLNQIQACDLVVETGRKSGFYLPLVAEFGGYRGLRFLKWCEGKLIGSRFSWLLWTQSYVLRGTEYRD